MKYCKKSLYIFLCIIVFCCTITFAIYIVSQHQVKENTCKTVLTTLNPCYEKRLDPHLNLGVHQVRMLGDKGNNSYFHTRVIVKAQSSTKLPNWSNIKICTNSGSVYTGFVEMCELLSLANLPGVDYVESGTPFILASKTKKLEFVNGPKKLAEFKAQNKLSRPIVGIIERSIDLYDQEFAKNGVVAGRFLFMWDQKGQKGQEPNEILNSYGTEYNSTIIRNAISPKSTNRNVSQDHGTEVARIVSRNVDSKVDWDMIAVKTTGEKATILDAVNYIFSKAQHLGRPAIINLSAGSDTGPHDGSSIFETGLTNAVGRGQLIIVSGGNDKVAGKHAEICSEEIDKGINDIALPLTVYATGHQSPNSYITMELWFSGNPNLSVSIVSPDGKCYGPVKHKEGQVFATDESKVSICNSLSQPPSGDNQILITLEDTKSRQSLVGTWTIMLDRETSVGTWECDAWLEMIGAYNGKFLDYVDPTETITSPGTSNGIICIGAGDPDKNIGRTAKSLGPTRDGRAKPDIWCPDRLCSSFAAAEITGKFVNELAQNPNLDPTMAIDKLRRQ